jgi:hypothetical protein
MGVGVHSDDEHKKRYTACDVELRRTPGLVNNLLELR